MTYWPLEEFEEAVKSSNLLKCRNLAMYNEIIYF